MIDIENLQEKVRKAKEAVESLEEPLKTEAFKKILDKLLEPPNTDRFSHIGPRSPTHNIRKINKRKRQGKSKLGAAGVKLKEESEKKKRELADKLNRSKYPEIYNLKSILPKALYVLKIMKEKGVKGLTPPEIQFILKEVFAIKHSSEAISVALNRKKARKYTDRNRTVIGRTVAYIYEIMSEGENYLKEKLESKHQNRVTKIDEGEEPD